MNAITEDDISGPSYWAQAQEGWGPMLTVACSVPHLLRKILPGQIGPGVTGARLAGTSQGPLIDPQHLPNQRDATVDDWGPHMIAYGGEPNEDDHALLVE
eukprot:6713887-Heterocapsa_arctica.AAC.1